MTKNNHYVITITRLFGSLGRPIAQKMSEQLGIEYYDRDIVDQAAQKLELPVSVIDQMEESAARNHTNSFFRMEYPLGRGTSDKQDKIFQAQQNIIKFLAEKESCIIVGRCADFTLRNMERAIHIYIYAEYEARLKHCIEDLHMEEDEARRMIADVDTARSSYHMNYAGFLPNDEHHKDILINSSFLGVDGTADYLVEAVRRKFGS